MLLLALLPYCCCDYPLCPAHVPNSPPPNRCNGNIHSVLQGTNLPVYPKESLKPTRVVSHYSKYSSDTYRYVDYRSSYVQSYQYNNSRIHNRQPFFSGRLAAGGVHSGLVFGDGGCGGCGDAGGSCGVEVQMSVSVLNYVRINVSNGLSSV